MKTFLKLGVSALTAALLLSGCATDSNTPASSSGAKPAATAMTDAEFGKKLIGQWTGDWSIAQFGGKFVLIVTKVEGKNVTGEGHFYGTANGDTKESLGKATIENGQLIAVQPSGMTLKIKLRDANTVTGGWEVGSYAGDLKAKRN